MPPLTALRAFDASARLGSFSSAAAELNMSQAAVSFQIRQLERHLGQAVFHRLPRGVELTPAGRDVAPAVIEAFAMMHSAFSQLNHHHNSNIAVTSSPTIGGAWIAPRLGAFQLNNPGISIKLDTSIDLQELGAKFDLSIRNGSGSWSGVHSHFLLPNLFTPLCSPKMVKTLRGIEKPADLARFPLRGKKAWWDQWVGEVGLGGDFPDPLGPSFDIDQLDVSAAIAGHGVVIASPIFFADELRSGILEQPFNHVSRQAERDYWLCYRGTWKRRSNVLRLRDFLLREAAQAITQVPLGLRCLKGMRG